jgi:hypothetical protein
VHDLIDTEELDASAERYWPDGFKEVIRGPFHQKVLSWLMGERVFEEAWKRHYRQDFEGHEDFCRRLADLLVIGAENGADEAWEELLDCFKREAPLPSGRRYARSTIPEDFLDLLHGKIVAEIISEYAREHLFADHLFEDYSGHYRDLGSFLRAVGEIVADGATRGAQDMMGRITRSIRLGLPLPPARRRPRRLK